ncbi:MAG: hypothetical protein M1816_006080 [Peltula sp. TS41687]|nr:MAG: hypothetical protein M1816_006080 [Peltula sp. TS41687]
MPSPKATRPSATDLNLPSTSLSTTPNNNTNPIPLIDTLQQQAEMPSTKSQKSWHSWTAAQLQVLINLWTTTDLDVTEMAEALSQHFNKQIRRKDVIMQLWLLDEDGEEAQGDDVQRGQSGIQIAEGERWRLAWPDGVEEVED